MTQARASALIAASLAACLGFVSGCESGGADGDGGANSDAPADAKRPGEGEDFADTPKPLPDAEAVFAAHIEASGGAEAIAGVQRLYIESDLTLASRQLDGKSRMWWSKGKFLVVDRVAQLGENRAGFDGERLWVEDSFNSWRDLEGREAELYRRGSSPFLIANWREHFERASSIGRRQVDGQTLIDVRAETPLGQEMIFSFDESTGLLIESAFDEVGPAVEAKGGRASRVVTRAEDYRAVGPLKLAHRQVTRSGLGEVVQTVIEVKLDPPIDDSRFEHPQSGERVPADPAKQAPLEAR